MIEDDDRYPMGCTLDGGRFELVELISGEPTRGLWRAEASPQSRRSFMVTFRRDLRRSPELDGWLDYDTAGISPVVFIGYPDGHTRPENLQWHVGWHLAVVEAEPDGMPLLDSERLSAPEVVRLGLGLCDTIMVWAIHASITRGLRPETIYLSGESGSRRFSGAIPRSFFLLYPASLQHGFARECYDPPAADVYVDIAVDDEVFTVGLLLWFAHLREHPYRVPGYPHLEENIWEDIRLPFTGPPELGRLLEAVLVADPDKRMKADELRHELARLARAWNVDMPPFPPPGLAEP